MKSFIKNKLIFIALIIGMCVGSNLLWKQASFIPVITHDDAISYLTAMGKESKYFRELPDNKWVKSKEIKQFWTRTDFFQFDTIRTDLANGDYHPPLYFWILHVWLNLQTVDIHTAPQLNTIFYLMTTFLIFLICIKLQCRVFLSIIMSLLWLFNGEIMSVSVEARQYGLLALTSSLYLFSLLLFIDKKSIKSLVFLGISALLGMLTHYHFSLLIIVSIIYLSVYFILKKEQKNLLYFFITLMISGIFFVLLHPDFYLSLLRQRHYTVHVFSPEIMIKRQLKIISTLKSFLPSHMFEIEIMLESFKIVIISLLLIYFYYWMKAREKLIYLKNILQQHEKWLPVVLLVGVTFMITLLYMYQYSPGHAMSVKYLMLISPFIFIVFGLFLNNIITTKFGYSLLFALLMFHILDTFTMVEKYRERSALIKTKNNQIIPYDIPLVIDTRARGVLPRILWDVDDNQKVYVSTQEKLVQAIPEITKLSSFVYISNYSYDNNIENQRKIINHFKEAGFIIKSTIWNCTNSKFFLFVKNN